MLSASSKASGDRNSFDANHLTGPATLLHWIDQVEDLKLALSRFMYVSKKALLSALDRLQGTASHPLKIWFVLKQMGLTNTSSVTVTTSSPNEALKRLFEFGDPEGKFFVPFAHTKRYFEMAAHAGRSIVQTTVKQWADKTAAGTDPTSYLHITRGGGTDAFIVKAGRRYPQGLGYGTDGFALEDGARVQIPDLSFALWYYRQENINEPFSAEGLIERLRGDLRLEHAEMEAIFVSDRDWTPSLQAEYLSDKELFEIVSEFMSGRETRGRVLKESQQHYSLRIQSTMSIPQGPEWLRVDPANELRKLIEGGSKALLLFGPPRSGKTRAIDAIVPRNDTTRVTIQIHDGWGYDELMVSFRPNEQGVWGWAKGELLQAIRDNKKFIVLEEINRTQASQALGEVFSLLEEKYRGNANEIKLRNGETFFIPEDTVLIASMNTLDKSTEDLDDALLGRFAAVEYPARVEDLISMLKSNGFADQSITKLSELFATIQQHYPLGHGYFAELKTDGNVIDYYLSRVRPVIQSHLKGYRDQDLATIDEKVDQLFNE
jgi:5-methylcytosine-specific restriction enzyme B